MILALPKLLLFLLIFMFKGEGFMYGMIKCFVFGLNGDGLPRKTLHAKCLGDNLTLKLLVCVLGILIVICERGCIIIDRSSFVKVNNYENIFNNKDIHYIYKVYKVPI